MELERRHNLYSSSTSFFRIYLILRGSFPFRKLHTASGPFALPSPLFCSLNPPVYQNCAFQSNSNKQHATAGVDFIYIKRDTYTDTHFFSNIYLNQSSKGFPTDNYPHVNVLFLKLHPVPGQRSHLLGSYIITKSAPLGLP